jgi:hypothetical protein
MPAVYDAGPDSGLPSWATGFFYVGPPVGASDAFDLRLGPGLQFVLAVTSCDLDSWYEGTARVDDAGVWLLPAPGDSTVLWPTELSLSGVANILLMPTGDGGLAAACDAGASVWRPGLSCGCGGYEPCRCDPFAR